MCRNTQMKYPIIAHWAICGSLLELFSSFCMGLLYLRRILFSVGVEFDCIFLRDEM